MRAENFAEETPTTCSDRLFQRHMAASAYVLLGDGGEKTWHAHHRFYFHVASRFLCRKNRPSSQNTEKRQTVSVSSGLGPPRG